MTEEHRIELIELYPQMFTWSVWREPNTLGKFYNKVLAFVHKHFKSTRNINYISQPNPYNYRFGVGDGWYKLLKSLIIKIRENDKNDNRITKVTQIKEKWGGLRFYVNGTSKENWKLIQFVENKSFTICESCGSQTDVGIWRNNGWLKTMCKKCAETEVNKLKSKKLTDVWEAINRKKVIKTSKSKLKI